MKKVLNSRGVHIPNLFRKEDGSFVVKPSPELQKNKLQHDSFEALNNEVRELKKQMKYILELLNGRT